MLAVQPKSTDGNSDQLVRKFFELLAESPAAIMTLGLAAFLGYGISFMLFDYRRVTAVKKPHYPFHMIIGLSYAAVVFIIVNLDILSRHITPDQVQERIPITMLTSFGVAFIVIILVAIYREVKK